MSEIAPVKARNGSKMIRSNESIYIDKKEVHSTENSHEKELVFIEVQHGKILKENEIVILSDIYGRLQ